MKALDIQTTIYKWVGEMYGGEEANNTSWNVEALARTIALTQITTEIDARQEAIDWQYWQSEQSLSIGELSDWAAYFEELGTKFDLTQEFKENGVL